MNEHKLTVRVCVCVCYFVFVPLVLYKTVQNELHHNQENEILLFYITVHEL